MEESPSGAGSHKRTRPVEAAGAADAQTRPPRLGKHCAFSPSFHRALPHHKHTQRKTRKSTGHWASWSPFSQFRTHMHFRRAAFSVTSSCARLAASSSGRNNLMIGGFSVRAALSTSTFTKTQASGRLGALSADFGTHTNFRRAVLSLGHSCLNQINETIEQRVVCPST